MLFHAVINLAVNIFDAGRPIRAKASGLTIGRGTFNPVVLDAGNWVLKNNRAKKIKYDSCKILLRRVRQ